MKFGLKLFLSYFAILGLGIYFFINSMLLEVKPGLRQSMETALIDSANLLAELIAPITPSTPIRIDLLKPAVKHTLARPIDATIWSHQQTGTELRIYVTNTEGKVIYDSENRDLGADYSEWNDVYLTLKGKYGARSTQENLNDRFSSVMYIGAPIFAHQSNGQRSLVGVLSIGKPNISVEPFWQAAQDNIRSKGLWLLLASALAGALLATWLSLNIHRLVEYAHKISRGESSDRPRINDPDLAKLAQAMEKMRSALDGKEYIEDYTLTLTHEMKSPLTALKGAAELIGFAQDNEIRDQLATNISQQTERLQALVDQVLALARLENLGQLSQPKHINLEKLIQEECEQLKVRLSQKEIQLKLELTEVSPILGDSLLLGQAIRNLIENALDFSPCASTIFIRLTEQGQTIELVIEDQGSGIPDYAKDKIWQRFYSLPRPQNGQKSTGLGLSFVQQIAQLHNAQVSLINNKTLGTQAKLSFTSNVSRRER